MRVYISVPINARNEETFAQKYEAAYWNVQAIEKKLRGIPRFVAADIVSTFTFNKFGQTTETEAMGLCIQAVLESDMVVIGDGWQRSKGCQLELKAAKLYNKEWIFEP